MITFAMCKQMKIYNMDIVTRLKEFINYLSIPVTQFADNCSIPRPTLSQLLNGRNKKVSDELIGKIHDAYPNLSVLWLMFGEGDMLHNSNIEISRPKNDVDPVNSSTQATVKEENKASIEFNSLFSQNPAEKLAPTENTKENSFGTTLDFTADANLQKDNQRMTLGADFNDANNTPSTNTITFNPDSNRKIVNIIVYYSDNSFESFVPNGKQ